MPVNNSYDIYNATLNADKPTVDVIIEAIINELNINIQNNISTFEFDIAPYTLDMTIVQINRIMDRVIAILRDKGIKVRLNITPTSVIYPNYNGYFNSMSSSYTLLTISWYTRNSQEFMKTYV